MHGTRTAAAQCRFWLLTLLHIRKQAGLLISLTCTVLVLNPITCWTAVPVLLYIVCLRRPGQSLVSRHATLSEQAQMAVALRHPQLAMQCHISIPGPQKTLPLAGASTEQGRQRLWYLAFGADMNQDCLTKQRGIHPTASIPCVLEGYVLSFAYRGLPYVEPSFANIEPLQWQPPPPVLSTNSAPTRDPHQPSSQGVVSPAVMYGAGEVIAQNGSTKPRQHAFDVHAADRSAAASLPSSRHGSETGTAASEDGCSASGDGGPEPELPLSVPPGVVSGMSSPDKVEAVRRTISDDGSLTFSPELVKQLQETIANSPGPRKQKKRRRAQNEAASTSSDADPAVGVRPQNGQLSSHPAPASGGLQPQLAAAGQVQVHGVAHQITRAEMDEICRTEGGSGRQNRGYIEQEVACVLYDRRHVTGVALLTHPSSKARSAQARLPSARYLSLLRQGAEQHGLQADYCQHLGKLQTYDADTWGKQLGAQVMRTFFAPLLLMMVRDIGPAVRVNQRLFQAVCDTGDAIILLGSCTTGCWPPSLAAAADTFGCKPHTALPSTRL